MPRKIDDCGGDKGPSYAVFCFRLFTSIKFSFHPTSFRRMRVNVAAGFAFI